MRKNEPDATLRVAVVPFYDLDGNLLKNQTFQHGSGEVFYYNSATNAWVAAAADATELGGANTTGMYLVQLQRAEVNFDTVVGVRLVKATYADQFWFEKIDNTPDVNVSTIAANALTAAAIAADAITAAKIADNAIDAGAIAAGAITAAKFAAGAIDAAAIATDAIDADALKADAVVEIQTGLSTSAALTAIGVDVTAIKAKTDSLPSDPADESLIIGATDAIIAAIASIQTKTDNLPADTAAELARIRGLHQENTLLDGGPAAVVGATGWPGVQYSASKELIRARRRVFASAADRALASAGAADGADGEIARYTFTGTGTGTGLAATFAFDRAL